MSSYTIERGNRLRGKITATTDSVPLSDTITGASVIYTDSKVFRSNLQGRPSSLFIIELTPAGEEAIKNVAAGDYILNEQHMTVQRILEVGRLFDAGAGGGTRRISITTAPLPDSYPKPVAPAPSALRVVALGENGKNRAIRYTVTNTGVAPVLFSLLPNDELDVAKTYTSVNDIYGLVPVFIDALASEVIFTDGKEIGDSVVASGVIPPLPPVLVPGGKLWGIAGGGNFAASGVIAAGTTEVSFYGSAGATVDGEVVIDNIPLEFRAAPNKTNPSFTYNNNGGILYILTIT